MVSAFSAPKPWRGPGTPCTPRCATPAAPTRPACRPGRASRKAMPSTCAPWNSTCNRKNQSTKPSNKSCPTSGVSTCSYITPDTWLLDRPKRLRPSSSPSSTTSTSLAPNGLIVLCYRTCAAKHRVYSCGSPAAASPAVRPRTWHPLRGQGRNGRGDRVLRTRARQMGN